MNRRLRFLLLAIPILWVAAAHLGPLVVMARISLLDVYPGPPDAAPHFELAAYAAFPQEAGYRASLLHSLAVAAATTLATLLLTYPLAYYVALRTAPERRGRRLMLLVAPFWTSEVLRVFALALLLAHRGALNAVLIWLGLTHRPIALLYGNGAVLTGMVYTVLLTMLLPLYVALDRLPPDLLDAASGLGANAWRRLIYVTLPLSARGVAAGVVLTFLASLGVFSVPALLGGPTTPVFATTIADLFGASSGRWPMGAAFGFILLAVGTACAAGLATVLGLMFLGRRRPERSS